MTWRELSIYFDETDRNEAATRAFLGACSLGDTSLATRLNPYDGIFLPLADWLGQQGHGNTDEKHDENEGT